MRRLPRPTQLRIDGAIYRFNARGYMATGWVAEDGQWFHYGASGGQPPDGPVARHVVLL